MKLPQGQDIKTIIQAPCLVAIDRAGCGLFISDYPRRLRKGVQGACVRLEEAGYVLTFLQEGMALVDWPLHAYLAWYQAQPEPAPLLGQARPAALMSMLSRHPAPLKQQDPQVLRQALLWARLGREAALCQTLESAFAKALRESKAPPYHGTRALRYLADTRNPEQERSQPC